MKTLNWIETIYRFIGGDAHAQMISFVRKQGGDEYDAKN